MNPLRITSVLLLIVVSVLLTGGCTQTTSQVSPTSTVVSIPSTPVQPSPYWVQIDPINDKQVGDIFTITSTTNLSAGDEIHVQVYEPIKNQIKSSSYIISSAVGNVKVIQGNSGINTLSFVVNSSTFHPNNFYTVTEMAENNDSFGYAFFNITPKKHPSE
jgi:hypothetical protein